MKAGSQFELLAKKLVGDVVMATPAISGDRLYYRTQHHLIAIGK